MSNEENPPTERTRAIKDRISAHERQARKLGLGLTVVVGLIVATAAGVLVALLLGG